jgi:predicted secreted hydrolase
MRNNLLWLLLLACGFGAPTESQYRAALPGYHYEFPRDHFNHPDFQTEWWYYTGNLKSGDGHRFGFELTFFRLGVSRDQPKDSVWSVNDLYLAHLALSDIDGHQFYHTERTNRAGPGLAGIDEQDKRVWNGNWQVRWRQDRQELLAIADDFSLQLSLESRKPPVIHGQNGVSQKAEGPGRASHYISLTRLLTSGSIDFHGRRYAVQGTSWMDHEFFTNRLDANQVGWDWLSLQLSDDTELMLFRIRHTDATIDSCSAGTYIDQAGKSTHLSAKDFTMEPLGETWRSPNSHGVYPIAWHISVPALSIDAEITTPLKNQEIATREAVTPSYWEGAITLSGQPGRSSPGGVGYLEMTGYSKPVNLAH